MGPSITIDGRLGSRRAPSGRCVVASSCSRVRREARLAMWLACAEVHHRRMIMRIVLIDNATVMSAWPSRTMPSPRPASTMRRCRRQVRGSHERGRGNRPPVSAIPPRNKAAVLDAPRRLPQRPTHAGSCVARPGGRADTSDAIRTAQPSSSGRPAPAGCPYRESPPVHRDAITWENVKSTGNGG